MDAAAVWSFGLTALDIDAYEYLVLLHAADEELNFGTDPQRIRDAADRLRAASPDHVLVQLLDRKATRANVVHDLLRESMRRRAAKLTKP